MYIHVYMNVSAERKGARKTCKRRVLHYGLHCPDMLKIVLCNFLTNFTRKILKLQSVIFKLLISC
jgi:hypothetical protein